MTWISTSYTRKCDLSFFSMHAETPQAVTPQAVLIEIIFLNKCIFVAIILAQTHCCWIPPPEKSHFNFTFIHCATCMRPSKWYLGHNANQSDLKKRNENRKRGGMGKCVSVVLVWMNERLRENQLKMLKSRKWWSQPLHFSNLYFLFYHSRIKGSSTRLACID